jgi:phosphatidylcholine synthase
MVNELTNFISRRRRVAAWLVHLFTASGAVLGLFTFFAIHQGEYIAAFWLMGMSILVDSVDGLLARWARTKEAAARIDGELLDNIIDYSTYVMAPAFLLIVSDLLPPGWRYVAASLVVLASAYQFTQPNAKTADHFFKGFPSYWNIVVFYLFFWQTSPRTNLIIVLVLVVLVFVPIKYVYPSRLDYLTRKIWLQWVMLIATLLWGVATAALLWLYPGTNRVLVVLSIGYILFYVLFSLYRTFVPLEGVSLEKGQGPRIYVPKKRRKEIPADPPPVNGGRRPRRPF